MVKPLLDGTQQMILVVIESGIQKAEDILQIYLHLVLLIQSGILLYSPNPLPMAFKANSPLGLFPFPTLVTVWHLMESFHLLSPSRLEWPKVVF